MTDRKKLLWWGTLVVGTHFIAVIWHVVLLVKAQPDFARLAILLLVLINLLPLAALVAFAKRFSKIAGAVIIIPLGIALFIGGYTHFLSAGPDNVLRMPPSPLTLPLQISSVLLALLEAFGCGVGFRMAAWSVGNRVSSH